MRSATRFWGTMVDPVWRVVVAAMYPARCAGCGRRGGWLCARCDDALPRFAPPWCAGCGVPVALARCRCGDAARTLDRVRSVAPFDGWLRPAIHALKYQDETTRVGHLGELLATTLRNTAGVDALVPVPLHPSRLRRRGYNQAELLARRAGDVAGVPVWTPLARPRATESQVGLDAAERATNVAGAFRVTGQSDLTATCLLLVDDVVTTGATLAACAFALKEAGASSVGAITLAREI